jgi:hypothetical protein
MEDPVAVFGRSDVLCPNPTFCNCHHPSAKTTYVCLLDTEWSIEDFAHDTGEYRETHIYWGLSRVLVASSMIIERANLIDLIDRCLERGRQSMRHDTRVVLVPLLESWKKELVLERIRRNKSARTIQKYFKESMSNPGYALCRRRLLREFAEGI